MRRHLILVVSGHMNHDELLEVWIPYKLQAIETLQLAWGWLSETDKPRVMHVVVDGESKLSGNMALVANPFIEVGLIHARSLLEFLGLRAEKGRLVQIPKRKSDDIAVEHFSTPQYPLTKVHPDAALAAYPGPKEDAEGALVAIFELANKGLAHITTETFTQEWTEQHLDIACRGIPVLIHNHLYAKLGRNVPKTTRVLQNCH